VTIEVLPLRASGGTKPEQYLVLFEDLPSGAPGARRRKAGKGAGGKARPRDTRTRHRKELEQELAATREFLQSVIDQKARANEELQTANDQLLSSNEELQSTNEELETAKEELQSGNEELTTVNEEVQIRNQELAQLSDDLGNLVVTVDLPLVILDNEGRIRRFTAGARDLLNLIPGDVGRPIRDIKPNVDLPELDAWLAEVIHTSVMREAEVRDRGGRWHRLQIRPYKTSDNEINGVVLSLLDIDTLRRSVEDARRARDFADGIVQAVQTPLLILDRDLHAMSANRAFYRTFSPLCPSKGAPWMRWAPAPGGRPTCAQGSNEPSATPASCATRKPSATCRGWDRDASCWMPERSPPPWGVIPCCCWRSRT
jgi:two-component system CheB/CheR fusion protein